MTPERLQKLQTDIEELVKAFEAETKFTVVDMTVSRGRGSPYGELSRVWVHTTSFNAAEVCW